MNSLAHRIADVPLTAQAVHELHDVKRLSVGHLAGFKESVDKCLTANLELVFVAGNLLWYTDGLDIGAVVAVDGDGLRVVDVVDDEVTLGAGNDADVVAYALGTGLHIAEHAVGQDKGHRIRQVHARLRLDARAVDADNVGREEHAGEIQGIDAQVEQCTATEVGSHDAGLVTHGIAKGGSDQTGLPYPTAADELTDGSDYGLVTRPDGLGKEYLLLMGQVDDVLRLAGIGHKGLLNQAGLACQQGRLGDVVVMGVRGGDIHEVHIRGGQQRLVGAIGLWDVPLSGKSLCLLNGSRTDSIGLAVLQSVECDGSLLGNPSCTNDTDT